MSDTGHPFRDPRLLDLAFTHKSFGNEQRGSIPAAQRDNERLEFLGDATLDLIVSKLLVDSYPDCSEGDLSKLRASLVNERSLARLAREMNLGSHLLLGKGEEQTGGREKDSILASTFEAVVAAVFLDVGFDAAAAWVEKLFAERVRVARATTGLEDSKTRLQEVIQARYKSAPHYELVCTSGPDHDKTFEVRLLINERVVATASGKSKKEAEQAAARAAFDQFGPNVDL